MHQTAVLLLLLRINIKLYSVANIVKETSESAKFGNVMRIEVKCQHSNHSFVKCVSFCFWMLAAGTSENTEVKAFGSIIYGSQVKFTVVQYLLILCTPGEDRNLVV